MPGTAGQNIDCVCSDSEYNNAVRGIITLGREGDQLKKPKPKEEHEE